MFFSSLAERRDFRCVGILGVLVAGGGCNVAVAEWNPRSLAPDEAIYAGAALGQSSFDQKQLDYDNLTVAVFGANGLTVLSGTSSLDDSDFSYGAVLGYRFAPFFAAEVAYVNLGKVKYRSNLSATDGVTTAPGSFNIDAKVTGVGVSGLAFLPLTETWEVFAQGGILLGNTDLDSTISFAGDSASDSFSSTSTDFFGGVGVAFHYGEQITVRGEYQRFLNVGNSDTVEGDVDLFGVQMMYTIF